MYETNHDTIELMDKIFLCFSRRTVCSSQSKDLLALKRRVDSGFKRAVIYPLYRDADDAVSGSRLTWNQVKSDQSRSEEVKLVEEHCCSVCGRLVVDLVKCDRCLSARFCGKCEKQHLYEHKISHETSKIDSEMPFGNTASSDLVGPADKCSYCSTPSDQLRKCSRCQSVQYCNQECQKKHWKEHKKYCGSPDKQRGELHSRSCYDIEAKAQATTIASRSAKCCYCFQPSETFISCAKCNMVQYCNKHCQLKHWKEHRNVCNGSTLAKKEFLSCSYCSNVSTHLRRCTECHAVQYCGKECQKRHWIVHKLHCKPKRNSSQTQPGSKHELLVATEDESDHTCSFCLRPAKDLKKCTRCRRAQYCNRVCQQKHWDDHKKLCKLAASQ